MKLLSHDMLYLWSKSNAGLRAFIDEALTGRLNHQAFVSKHDTFVIEKKSTDVDVEYTQTWRNDEIIKDLSRSMISLWSKKRDRRWVLIERFICSLAWEIRTSLSRLKPINELSAWEEKIVLYDQFVLFCYRRSLTSIPMTSEHWIGPVYWKEWRFYQSIHRFRIK